MAITNETITKASGAGIIESDSNANGYYDKYANGTLICYKNITVTRTIDAATGSIFISTSISFGDWALSFIDTPCTVSNLLDTAFFSWIANTADASTTSAGTCNLASSASRTSGSYSFSIIGIGKWQ